MTNLITEARELCAAATPGPWERGNGSDVFTELGADNGNGAYAAQNDAWQIADCDPASGTDWCIDLGADGAIAWGQLKSQSNAAFIARSRTLIPELCDALEKAEEKNKQLMHEVCKLACESVEREKTLARMEAEVMAACDSVRWIPVTERLPQPNVDALVLTDAGSIRQGYIGHATGRWCSGGLVMVPTVTHWMPLPAPPEEGAEK